MTKPMTHMMVFYCLLCSDCGLPTVEEAETLNMFPIGNPVSAAQDASFKRISTDLRTAGSERRSRNSRLRIGCANACHERQLKQPLFVCNMLRRNIACDRLASLMRFVSRGP